MKWYMAATVAMLIASAGCGGEADDPSEVEDTTAPPAVVETVREPAAPGMGEKGRDYGTGPVATPVGALFSTKEKLAYEIQIPHTLEIYKASHGDYPKTHEEFIKEIIEAGGIKLPELPQGQRYVYDPETHTLMIEHPVRQDSSP
jgi:hypothetical protein